MKVYKNFNIGTKFKNSAIAIGNFDGFHLGHQKVIKKGKDSSIINIASVSSFIAQPEFVPYNTSKGAVIQLSKCFR